MINVESTRHPNWIPVEPGDGVIREGDRYRVEYTNGYAVECASAGRDYTRHGFDPDATYYIWPRPEPKPWEAIPEGKENAKFMAVIVDGGEPVVGMYFRVGEVVRATSPDPERDILGGCLIDRITSAVPMTVVPDEALDKLRALRERCDDSDFLVGDVIRAAVAFLAAVDGADQ